VDARQVLGGRYRLEERLGAGGMSVVWRAFDLILGRSVAVKVLSGHYAADGAFRESILAEAQAAARVSHPHLASVHDYGESVDADGRPVPYVVMELLSGPTLMQRLASGPMPARTGLRVCAEIAEGLAAAHAHNLVHRDVKPGNVMLTPVGAKLVDFGVAAVAGAPSGPGPDGRIMGTPNYVAPERLISDAVEPASDVYGLGLLIFRVLTGGLPWPSGTLSLEARADPDPLPPIDGVPADIGELYLSCVAFDPGDRPSAHEAAARLTAAAGVWPPLGDGLDDEITDDSAVITPSTGTIVVPVVVPGPQLARPRPPGGVSARRDGRVHRAVPAVIAAAVAAVAAVLIVTRAGLAGAPDPLAVDDPTGPAGSAVATASTGPEQTNGPDPSQPAGPGDGPVQGPNGTNGDPPTVPPPTTPLIAPTTSSPPTLSNWTSFWSDGGSIVAACLGSQAYIDSYQAATGYTPQNVEPGPAERARIQFVSRQSVVTMVVRCEEGKPAVRTGVTHRSPSRSPSPSTGPTP
jgi:eukaryotic-like serine/threonine-protein kinase